MTLKSKPLYTEVFDNAIDFMPEPGSLYIYASGREDRNSQLHFQQIGTFTQLAISEQGEFEIKYRYSDDQVVHKAILSNRPSIRKMWSRPGFSMIYLDITGLDHRVWAPVLREALGSQIPVSAVYIEPKDYKRSVTPTESSIFDLSESIGGIAPLPGFISLAAEEEDFCFVPLLGFEGARFKFILENLQPPKDKVFPVVGVPGFKIEFPFFACFSNRQELRDDLVWRNLEFASANCPFSIYYLLTDLSRKYNQCALKVAPIGTKPHALGAVMFAILSSRSIELVYDHPVRSPNRSTGVSKLLVYYLSKFRGGYTV